LRKALNTQSKTTGNHAKNRGDKEQNSPAAGVGKTTVNGEYGGNPGHGEQHEEQGVHKSAAESDAGPGVKEDNQQDPNAQPGINAEIESGVRQRERGS
jgi:hypothetical protein